MSHRFQNKKYFLVAGVLFCVIIYFVYVYTSYARPLYFRNKMKGFANLTTISITQNEEWESAHIRIALWVSRESKPSDRSLERMSKVVDHWNSAGGKQCKMGEFEISRHCKLELTSKHEIAEKADAVVFYMFQNGYQLSDLPKKRREDQVWVMYAREPPTLSQWQDPLNDLFNWTMSYRRNSDIWTPYGRMFLKNNSHDSQILIENNNKSFNLSEWINGKTKLVAVVMSRCQSSSKREYLMLKMIEAGIEIDTYGECGNRSICGRYEKNCGSFWSNLGKNYKFYLAFENSHCQDYITEKFWRALNVGMVPIVYGGGEYSLEGPPGSYIDVRDFSTAKKLKKYLNILDKNDEKYGEYFEWRRIYTGGVSSWVTQEGCLLCKKIEEERKFKKNSKDMKIQYYEDLNYWWQHGTESLEPACSNKPLWEMDNIFNGNDDAQKYENLK